MEFWGAEVKAGKPLKVKPDEDCVIHLSQVCIDNGKKGETALLYVTVDGKRLVIGKLSQGSIPQISLDLIFDQEFELSHSLETGSVHFTGYKSPNMDDQECYSSFDSSSEEEVEVPATDTANGNAGAAASSVVKADSEPKAKPAEEVKHESDDDDDEGSESGCICFSSGWMIEMMRKMILGTKKK
ncbi:histone deacetylase HDT2-like [Brassica rapa]|uniref:BnaA02g05810D protein n=2 Tax=Brassica TaxID=3705 RepID=A0A078F3T5_BRANA|nr:histone deacetylase HDT2-like [Brassica rapa]CDY09155.1 BnaA02g05810D [Brassica napus]